MLLQVHLVINLGDPLPTWKIYLFQLLTILTYTNSAINPVLYGYTNDNFKAAFAGAFRCTVDPLRPPSAAESRSYQSNAALVCSASACASAAVCRKRVVDTGAPRRPSRCRLHLTQPRKHLTVEYEFSVLRTSVAVLPQPTTCHIQRTMHRISKETDVLLADNGACLHRINTGSSQQVALGNMNTESQQAEPSVSAKYAGCGQDADVHETSGLSPVVEKTMPWKAVAA